MSKLYILVDILCIKHVFVPSATHENSCWIKLAYQSPRMSSSCLTLNLVMMAFEPSQPCNRLRVELDLNYNSFLLGVITISPGFAWLVFLLDSPPMMCGASRSNDCLALPSTQFTPESKSGIMYLRCRHRAGVCSNCAYQRVKRS